MGAGCTAGCIPASHSRPTLRSSPPPTHYQAAAAMAAAAAANAADPTFESPYTREALQEGIDLPIWEKLLGASWKVGGRGGLEQVAEEAPGAGERCLGRLLRKGC